MIAAILIGTSVALLALLIGWLWSGGVAKIKLFREFLRAELVYVKHYDEEVNKIYAGGDEPRVIGPGRVEILYFPLKHGEKAE